jgi:monofunctional biosynthetic peptidoglycan transglycosylase
MKMWFWLKIRRLILYLVLFFCLSSIVVVGLFKYLPVPISTVMIYQHIKDYQDNHDYKSMDYQWVSRNNISILAFLAVIASEDQLFFQHSGFDLDSINSAIDTYLDGGRLRGASTISQQVAKNLFLIPVKSFWRKGLEAWFTVLIEYFWSKQRILEVYLNIAEFGNHLFGIEAASRYYFGITAKQLSAQQAALLAATLPNPLRFHADRPTAYVRKRQNWILNQMRNINYHH